MKENRSTALNCALSCILLVALLLSICGSILCADHVCDDPCCVICRFSELRRQLAWAVLSMAVAAFGGFDKVMEAYRQALEGDYKFGPYGDALLII